MLKRVDGWIALAITGSVAFATLASVPTAAGEIYAWRTDDGGYAFADDEKSIPARYRDRAEIRASNGLSDYERMTRQDPSASARYAERLAARLEYLRAFNAEPVEPAAPFAQDDSRRKLSVRAGGEGAPLLDVTAAAGEGPIVVETLHTRPRGKAVTRRSVVIRQGDRTLAVVKSRSRQKNVSTDILSEEDLER